MKYKTLIRKGDAIAQRFPEKRAATTTPRCAQTVRKVDTSESRHNNKSTRYMAIRLPDPAENSTAIHRNIVRRETLSASGSRIFPKSVTSPRRRAAMPSNRSVSSERTTIRKAEILDQSYP